MLQLWLWQCRHLQPTFDSEAKIGWPRPLSCEMGGGIRKISPRNLYKTLLSGNAHSHLRLQATSFSVKGEQSVSDRISFKFSNWCVQVIEKHPCIFFYTRAINRYVARISQVLGGKGNSLISLYRGDKSLVCISACFRTTGWVTSAIRKQQLQTN